MSGLKFDNEVPPLIGARTHSIIDYLHVGTNFLVGALFAKSNKPASCAAFLLGAGVLANTLMTDYPHGVFRLYNFKVHGALDYASAVTSAALPELMGFADTRAAIYFYAQGAAETAIAGVSNYADDTGAVRHSDQSF